MKKLFASEGFQYVLCIVIAILGTLFICEFVLGQVPEQIEEYRYLMFDGEDGATAAEAVCMSANAKTTYTVCVGDKCLTRQGLLDALGIDHKCEDTETE